MHLTYGIDLKSFQITIYLCICISYGDLKSFQITISYALCISYGDLKSFNRYLMLNA